MAKSRTKIALQWAVEELLSKANTPCGFYLLTIPELMPWKEVSRRHRYMLDLMNKAVARRNLKPFGGVRVFEEGEQTKRPHAHWVMAPRFSQKTVQHFATAAGLGHVWLDTRPAGDALGIYMSKYMSKSKSIPGVRRWSCFGQFSATIKTGDISIDSEHTRAFADAINAAKGQGMSGAQAYTYAARAANAQKYGLTKLQMDAVLKNGGVGRIYASDGEGGPGIEGGAGSLQIEPGESVEVPHVEGCACAYCCARRRSPLASESGEDRGGDGP